MIIAFIVYHFTLFPAQRSISLTQSIDFFCSSSFFSSFFCISSILFIQQQLPPTTAAAPIYKKNASRWTKIFHPSIKPFIHSTNHRIFSARRCITFIFFIACTLVVLSFGGEGGGGGRLWQWARLSHRFALTRFGCDTILLKSCLFSFLVDSNFYNHNHRFPIFNFLPINRLSFSCFFCCVVFSHSIFPSSSWALFFPAFNSSPIAFHNIDFINIYYKYCSHYHFRLCACARARVK